LKVRRAKVKDIPQVIRLVSTLKNHDKMLEDFKRAVCCKTQNAFVVEVKNHPNVPIVGMAVARYLLMK
jgi:N-acetylglutamate synthase-like GNAT family acetyltransferase